MRAVMSCCQTRHSRVVWTSPVKPVDEKRREQGGLLMHERVTGVLDHRERGMRIPLKQSCRVDVPDGRIVSSRRDQGRRREGA
jgi:hypothetical protein